MKEIYRFAMVFLFFVFFASANAYSQKYPTNNLRKYDSTSAILEINDLHKKILNGEDFGLLATKFTQDPGSFKNNGILRKLSLDTMDDGFKYYIKKLKIGEVSKPFETLFGWHIAKVLEIDNDGQYLIQHIVIMYGR